jgi:hypothetical protein
MKQLVSVCILLLVFVVVNILCQIGKVMNKGVKM